MHGGDSSFEMWSGLLAKAGDASALNDQQIVFTPNQQTVFAQAMMIFFIIMAILVWLGFFVLVIYSCIWAYRDAERRGKPGILIALLVFLVWPIGLLIWLVARPERTLPLMPPLPPDPESSLGPGEWIGYSLGFLLIPFANVVVSSILYYVWRRPFPRKARQINGLGWTVFVLEILAFAIPFLIGSTQQSS